MLMFVAAAVVDDADDVDDNADDVIVIAVVGVFFVFRMGRCCEDLTEKAIVERRTRDNVSLVLVVLNRWY